MDLAVEGHVLNVTFFDVSYADYTLNPSRVMDNQNALMTANGERLIFTIYFRT